MMISFTIPGQPQGKARPKVVRLKNGHTHAFTPEKTESYENLIRWAFKECTRKDFVPHDGAIYVEIAATHQIPQSWSRKKRQAALAGTLPCLSKPDLDNLEKVICDALNGIAYVDDKQIVEVHKCKAYGERPGVAVLLRFDN